jgi:peptidoglycan/LPS O-acetylase OafA/YrhL
MEKQAVADSSQKTARRSWQYDLLRIISMILVMLFHYTFQFSSKFYEPGFAVVFPQRWATFGVSVFLVLNGFFSYKSIRNDKLSPWQYLMKRAKRLLPTFWLCLIITSAVTVITKFADISVKQFILNFFLINRFVNVPFVDGAYWYMLIIVAFTVFVFLGKCLKDERKRSILYALYTIVYLLFGIVDHFVRKLPTVFSFALFDYINKCLVGLLIAYLWNYKGKLSTKNKVGGVLSTTLLLVGEFLWMAPDKAIVEIVAVCAVLAVVLFGGRIHCSSKVSSVIGYVAGESYFIYLIHQQIGYIILKTLVDIGVNCHIALIIVILSIAVLAITHYVGSTALNRAYRNRCT